MPPRERAALAGIFSGVSIEETATKLGVTSATVREYLDSSRRRLRARTMLETVAGAGGC